MSWIRIRRQNKDKLESMVDEYGLSELCTMLAEVCWEKNFSLSKQDLKAADLWEADAGMIAALTSKVNDKKA